MNKSLKPLDPDIISSYIAKTLLFWKCHQFPSGHSHWNEKPIDVLTAVQGIFEDFSRNLETGFLPSYFVPQLNVIERFNSTLRKQCIKQIKNVVLPNMSRLIEWPEIREIISLGESLLTYEQRYLDYLNYDVENIIKNFVSIFY